MATQVLLCIEVSVNFEYLRPNDHLSLKVMFEAESFRNVMSIFVRMAGKSILGCVQYFITHLSPFCTHFGSTPTFMI